MPAGATAHDDKFSKTTAATIYFKEQATNRAKKNKTTTYNQFSKSQFTSVKLKALKYLAAQETKVCQL